MSQSLSGSVILAADIDSRRASVLPQALQDKVAKISSCCTVGFSHSRNQVDSLRKGSGHVFVGQLSWKEECSIPVITSAEITAAQFANSYTSSFPLPTITRVLQSHVFSPGASPSHCTTRSLPQRIRLYSLSWSCPSSLPGLARARRALPSELLRWARNSRISLFTPSQRRYCRPR